MGPDPVLAEVLLRHVARHPTLPAHQSPLEGPDFLVIGPPDYRDIALLIAIPHSLAMSPVPKVLTYPLVCESVNGSPLACRLRHVACVLHWMPAGRFSSAKHLHLVGWSRLRPTTYLQSPPPPLPGAVAGAHHTASRRACLSDGGSHWP